MLSESTKQAFKEAANFTLSVCVRMCPKMGMCCSREYCEFAIEAGAEDGVEYKPTGNEKLPMFDSEKKVCIAAPHHRQLCSMHHCHIESVAHIKGMPEETKIYWKLRDKVNNELAKDIDLKF